MACVDIHSETKVPQKAKLRLPSYSLPARQTGFRYEKPKMLPGTNAVPERLGVRQCGGSRVRMSEGSRALAMVVDVECSSCLMVDAVLCCAVLSCTELCCAVLSCTELC